jgi:hypothetical protein
VAEKIKKWKEISGFSILCCICSLGAKSDGFLLLDWKIGGSVWLPRKSRNGKKFLGFLFRVVSHSVQNLMGFCFWIGRLGCYYFLVHNDENQNILLHDVIVVVGVFSR